MKFVFISLSISTFSILIGFIYSYFVLNTQKLEGVRIQKIQYRKGHFRNRLGLIGLNLGLLFLLASVGLYFAQDFFVIEPPTIGLFLFQVVFILLIDDLFFYGFHRLLHKSPFLFAKIHRIHHQAHAPFPLEYIYVHPLEWMIGTTGIVISILLLQEVNAYSFWFYVLFRNLHEVDIHSGIRSYFAQYIPFFGTVEHHDKHHEKVMGNYASSLTLWDKIFKTEIK